MRVFNEGLFERFTRDAFIGLQEDFSTQRFNQSVLQMSEEKSRQEEFDFGVQWHQTYISALITRLNQKIEQLNNLYTTMLEYLTHKRVMDDDTADPMTALANDGSGGGLVREGKTILDKNQYVYNHGYNPYYGSRAVNVHDDTLVRLNYVDYTTPQEVWINDYKNQQGQPAKQENYSAWNNYNPLPQAGWMWRSDGNHTNVPPTFFNRSFELNQLPESDVQVTMAVDDKATVFINGVQVGGPFTFADGVQTFTIPRGAFVRGFNQVVIKWEEFAGGGPPDGINFRMNFPDGNVISTYKYPENFHDYNGNGSFDQNDPLLVADNDTGNGGNNNGIIDQPGVEFQDLNGNGIYDNVNAEYDPNPIYDWNQNGQYDGDNVDSASQWSWTEVDIIANPPQRKTTQQAPPSYKENGAMWSTIAYLWKWDLDRINAGYRTGVDNPDDTMMINTTVLQPNRPISPVLKVGDRVALSELGGIRPGGINYTPGFGYVFDDSALEAIVTSVETLPDGTTRPTGWKIVYEGQGNADPNDTTGVPMVQNAPKKIIKESITSSFDYNTPVGQRWNTTAVVGGPAGWYEADLGSPGVWPVPPGSDPLSSGIFSTQLDFSNTLLSKPGEEQGTIHLEAEINDSAEIRLANSIIPTWDPPSIGNLESGVYFGGGANTRYHAGGANGTVTSDLTFDASALTQNNNLVEIFVEDTHDVGENFRLINFELTARAIESTWPPTPRYRIDANGNIFDAFGDGFQEDPAGIFYQNTSQKSNLDANYDAAADNKDLWDYVPDVPTNKNTYQVGSFSSNFLYYREQFTDPKYVLFQGSNPSNIARLPVLNFDGREENRYGELLASNRVTVANPLSPAFSKVVMGYVEQDQAIYQQHLLDLDFRPTAFWRDIQDGVDIVGRNSEFGQVTQYGSEGNRINDAKIELNLFNKETYFLPGGHQEIRDKAVRRITEIKVTIEGDQPIPENESQIYSTNWRNTDAGGVAGNTDIGDDWAIVVKERFNQLVKEMSSGAVPPYTPNTPQDIAEINGSFPFPGPAKATNWYYAQNSGSALWFPYVAGTVYEEGGSYKRMTCDFRKSFTLTQAEYDAIPPGGLQVNFGADDEAYLVVNGQQIGFVSNSNVPVTIPKSALAVGDNVIGGRAYEWEGGQHFSVVPTGAGWPPSASAAVTTSGGNNWQSRVVPDVQQAVGPYPGGAPVALLPSSALTTWSMQDQNEVQGLIQRGLYAMTSEKAVDLYLDRSMSMTVGAPIQIEVKYHDGSTDVIGKAGSVDPRPENPGGMPNSSYQPDYANYLVVGKGRRGGSYDNLLTNELKRMTEDPEFLEVFKYNLLDDVYVTASTIDTYNDTVFGKLTLTWDADRRRIKVRQMSFVANWHS